MAKFKSTTKLGLVLEMVIGHIQLLGLNPNTLPNQIEVVLRSTCVLTCAVLFWIPWFL